MSPSRNEQTSKPKASDASKILRVAERRKIPPNARVVVEWDVGPTTLYAELPLVWEQVTGVAASALTQSPSRPSQKGTTKKWKNGRGK